MTDYTRDTAGQLLRLEVDGHLSTYPRTRVFLDHVSCFFQVKRYSCLSMLCQDTYLQLTTMTFIDLYSHPLENIPLSKSLSVLGKRRHPHPDLAPSSVSPSLPSCPHTSKAHLPQNLGPYRDCKSAGPYPSPPPTGSSHRHSIPLPPSPTGVVVLSSESPTPQAVSSGPAMDVDAPSTLLSPPPSNRTTDCALPDADVSAWHTDSQPQAADPHSNSYHAGESFSAPQLLSPLSSAWASSEPDQSEPEPQEMDDSPMNLCHLPVSHVRRDHDVQRPSSILLDHPPESCLPWPTILPLLPLQSSGLIYNDEDSSPGPGLFSIPPSFENQKESLALSSTPSQMSPTSMEGDHHHQPASTDIFWSSPISPASDLEDDDFGMASPSSPCLRDLTELPDLQEWSSDLYPESPVLRATNELPGATPEECASLQSPNAAILSLPGADTDDDLIPLDLSPPKTFDKYSGSIFSDPAWNAPSSLLLEDLDLVPTPDSPPVDNLDIDVSLLSQDPDLHRLSVIRKKSQAKEINLRQIEVQALERGAVHARAHVRQERKRQKEKFREITALIRLKMGESTFKEPLQPEDADLDTKARKLTTMDQLVARMFFKRHENLRPLSVRNAISLDAVAPRSPLARYTPFSTPGNCDGLEL